MIGRMTTRVALCVVLMGSLVSARQASFSNPYLPDQMRGKQAVVETDMGTFVLELLPDLAPNHVGYFMKLAGEGAYDGTIFHRVIRYGLIQGGDPLSTDPAKAAEYGTGGLKVLAPGTVEDARHMLAAALADPNPVLIFEHVVLYNVEDDLDPAVTAVDIEHAKVRRPGKDASLVTYGNSLPKCHAAADALAKDGIDAEVIDLRVLRPLDFATIAESVARTHRCVIVDEGWKTGSISAEIAARLVDDSLYDLDAPVRRVCSREVPVPYAAHMEEATLPRIDDIVATTRALVRPS